MIGLALVGQPHLTSRGPHIQSFSQLKETLLDVNFLSYNDAEFSSCHEFFFLQNNSSVVLVLKQIPSFNVIVLSALGSQSLAALKNSKEPLLTVNIFKK